MRHWSSCCVDRSSSSHSWLRLCLTNSSIRWQSAGGHKLTRSTLLRTHKLLLLLSNRFYYIGTDIEESVASSCHPPIPHAAMQQSSPLHLSLPAEAAVGEESQWHSLLSVHLFSSFITSLPFVRPFVRHRIKPVSVSGRRRRAARISHIHHRRTRMLS